MEMKDFELIVVEYFKNLFSLEGSSYIDYVIGRVHPKILAKMNNLLC